MTVVADKKAFCYSKLMSTQSGISKMAGRFGLLLMFAGLAAFFFGIFGGPRSYAFAGVAMMVASIVAFFLEEYGPKK